MWLPLCLFFPGNGHIDFEDLRTVLMSCMGESALQFSDDQLDELTRALLEDADATNSGSITFEELQTALSKHPGLVENLTIRLDVHACMIQLTFEVIYGLYIYVHIQCCKLVSATPSITST